MTFKGYEVEKTAPKHWYVTSKNHGLVLGPFKTRKHAIEYAEDLDARS